MNVDIHPSWKPYLQTEFNKPYFKSLTDFVKTEYNNHLCFPDGSEIFNAFNHCSFDDVKVVIIGQDPYHNYNQANGLCFSVNDGIVYLMAVPYVLIAVIAFFIYRSFNKKKQS